MRPILLMSALTLVCASQTVSAQPGMTPPGRVPPGPAPGPPPGPPPPPPTTAPAQGGYYAPAQPMPPPQPSSALGRHGWNIGFSVGLGSMTGSNGSFECPTCDDPPAFAFDLHVGTMVSPSLALQGEIWSQVQVINEGDNTVEQGMILLAAQYWLLPRLWVKAGIGVATLSTSYQGESEPVDEGPGFMLAAGYEISHSRGFGFDIQVKTGTGFYQEIEEDIATTVVGLGLNWY